MKKVTVTLNGEEHVVEELRSKANREWRGRLQEEFEEVAEAIIAASSTEMSDKEGLEQIVLGLSGQLIGSVETISSLLEEYDPTLPLDEAYDSEILDAFTKVLGLAFPFGEALRQVRSTLGRLQEQT